jgi:hypothetical protein
MTAGRTARRTPRACCDPADLGTYGIAGSAAIGRSSQVLDHEHARLVSVVVSDRHDAERLLAAAPSTARTGAWLRPPSGVGLPEVQNGDDGRFLELFAFLR